MEKNCDGTYAIVQLPHFSSGAHGGLTHYDSHQYSEAGETENSFIANGIVGS